MSGFARSYARTTDVRREVRRLRTSESFGQLSNATTPQAQAQLLEEVVLLTVCVARAIARRYHHRGLEDDDVDQTAYAAPIRAVQKFDPDRGHDFLTYAVPSIHGEIMRHFRRHGWTIQIPRRIQETHVEIDRADPDIDAAGPVDPPG